LRHEVLYTLGRFPSLWEGLGEGTNR
jgi:hypothetical protein